MSGGGIQQPFAKPESPTKFERKIEQLMGVYTDFEVEVHRVRQTKLRAQGALGSKMRYRIGADET
jgi:hypothetical protein